MRSNLVPMVIRVFNVRRTRSVVDAAVCTGGVSSASRNTTKVWYYSYCHLQKDNVNVGHGD